MPAIKKRMSREESRMRAIKALQLKMAGYTYESIAQQLGYCDKSGALKAVDRILDRHEDEQSDRYRAMENQRLEELQAVWWTKALYPGQGYDAHKEQLDATKAVLAVMKRRAALLGLNVDPRIQAKQQEEDQYEVIWDVEIVREKLNLLSTSLKNA